MKGMRWALVTFSIGISCGLLGYFIREADSAIFCVVSMASIGALFGGLEIGE